MAMDYKLLPSQNGKRVRIISDDNQDINVVVGDILATWPEGTFIEILNLVPDPTATVTLVGDTGVIVRQYDASNGLPYNHYARVSQVVPGEWDMHIYSALTLNDLTDVVITAPANNNVVVYDDDLLQWVNRPAPFVPNTQFLTLSYGAADFAEGPTEGWSVNTQGDFAQPNYVIYDNSIGVKGFRFQQQGLYRVDWQIRASANPWPPTGITTFMANRFSGGTLNADFRGLDSAVVYRPQYEVGFTYRDNFTWMYSCMVNIGPTAATGANNFISLTILAYNAAEVGETVDYNVNMLVQRINDGVDGA